MKLPPLCGVRVAEERVTGGGYCCADLGPCVLDKGHGGKVWAVGTTVARALETAATQSQGVSWTVAPGFGWTDLFIYPPHGFKIVDALLTNFHLPRSTLLMLVAAFAGHGLTMGAYRHALEQRYRFYSYGDAMAVI